MNFFEFHLRFQAIFAISTANTNLQIDILTTDMSKLKNQVGIALFFEKNCHINQN